MPKRWWPPWPGNPSGSPCTTRPTAPSWARPGLHLEDLYVRAEHRGAGVGLALLRHLASLAVDRGCGRMEWWVLRTNDPALRFCQRLHARGLDEIEVMRLEGKALQSVADGYQPPPTDVP